MLNPVEPSVPTYQANIVPTEPYSWPHCGEVLRKTFLCILWLRGDSFGPVSLLTCYFHSIAQTFFPVWGSHWLFLSILSVSIDACMHMYMCLHMCVCTCVHIPTEDRGQSWVSTPQTLSTFSSFETSSLTDLWLAIYTSLAGRWASKCYLSLPLQFWGYKHRPPPPTLPPSPELPQPLVGDVHTS